MDRSVKTFNDCLELLRDFEQFDSARSVRLAKRSVREAYESFPSQHTWNFLKKRMLLQTVAPYATGTIAYDYTGGSRERLVTLTGGTWPEWAGVGRILINAIVYQVQERVSDTEIVLDESACPTADIASGSTYSLFQFEYPLFDEVEQLVSVVDVVNQRRLVVQTFDHANPLSRWWHQTSMPIFVVPINNSGKMKLGFYPSPNEARTYEITYVMKPRAPKLFGPHTTGTVSLTAGSRVATFSSNLPVDVDGCVLRIGTSTLRPVGVYGTEEESGTTPFVEQFQILEKLTSTTVRLTETPATSYTTVKHEVDDIIDLHPRITMEALQRLIEQHWVTNLRYGVQGANDGGPSIASVTDRANNALTRAKEADSQYMIGTARLAETTSPFHFPTVSYAR